MNKPVGQDLKKLREKRYPAYVLKVADIMDVAPYYLMPLWTAVESEVEKREASQNLTDLSTYLKTVKAFREVLVSNGIVSVKDIERYMNATTTITQDTVDV